jgi:hypothetical protein
MSRSEASGFARSVAKMACEDRDTQARARRRRERPFVWLTRNHARLRDPEHREREVSCLRKRPKEAGIKELGFATHLEGEVHGDSMVLRGGAEQAEVVERFCAESIREAFSLAD